MYNPHDVVFVNRTGFQYNFSGKLTLQQTGQLSHYSSDIKFIPASQRHQWFLQRRKGTVRVKKQDGGDCRWRHGGGVYELVPSAFRMTSQC